MICTTIGLYSNGDFMLNGVTFKNLGEHITFNITYRPGRALILDGKCIYQGNVSDKTLNNFLKINTHKVFVDTSPYH